MKVIIIGAGIAGLTFGLACQQAGWDVRIIEKAKKLECIGGGILLWPHGLRYLESLGLVDCLRSVQMSATRMNIVGHRGQVVYSEAHAELYRKLEGEILPVDRSEVQQRLVALLNEGVLSLGVSCTAIEEKDDGAYVMFDDGTEARADLVVGADGIHSSVRAAINPSAQPQYAGFCWWGGMIDRSVVPHFPVDEVQFILGQNKLCSIWPAHGERFMWYLPVKMPLSAFNQACDGQVQAQEICNGWHDDVVSIITAPQTTQRFHLPIDELAPGQLMTKGRTVLIGDAACASGPLLGQGANRAIEDAYVLVNSLKCDTSDVPQQLLSYAKKRLPRHQRFFELEHLSSDALMHESLEALMYFEEQLPHINLSLMYQDMIPLVNKEACDNLLSEAV
tara:strand:+ start:818 stop:1993 length:1176 start_codon:yes stop_codon:yes gene_type:complete